MWDNLLPEQRDFFFTSRAEGRMRVARCTRRAGKTTGGAYKILLTMIQDPHAVCLFVAQTRTIIEDTIWPELQKIVAEFNLPFEFHGTKLRMSHKRGSGRALFRGASDTKNIQKLRGLGTGGKFVLAILDESGHFGADFEKLVASVITPALRDVQGELLLIGTPGDYPEGLFYEASSGLKKNWVRRRWTLQDNTKIEPAARDLATIREEEGLTEDDPIYIREWLGEYALNMKTMMFTYDPQENSYEGGLPDVPGGWTYWGGIDFGWTDETAIVVLAWNHTTKKMYVVDSWSASEQTSDMTYRAMLMMKQRWPIAKWVGDTGGMGKKDAMNIWIDYKEWIEPADKQGKLDHVSYMNAAFKRRDLWVRRGLGVHSELPKVLWNDTKTDAHKKAKDNNAIALLYVWRAANNLAGKRSAPTPLSDEVAAWPEEETRAKLSNTVEAPEAPWFLQDLYGGPNAKNDF